MKRAWIPIFFSLLTLLPQFRPNEEKSEVSLTTLQALS